MPEGILHLFARRPLGQVFTDIADLLIVTYVIYRALLVLRGTRAMQMGTGLLLIGLVYVAAKYLALVTLLNLLSTLLSSIILIVVVVFQNDIRRGLMRVGSRAFLGGFARAQESRVIDEVVASATELARHRMGALIAFEQDANLDEFVVAQGIPVESVVTRELLVSLFVPESVNKLHDGAVIIRNLRIAKAGVFFPMPESRIVDTSLGSRHRAALGITEETDAVVVVVSEERGTISFCFSGNIVSNLDGASLRQALLGLFGRKARKKGTKKVSTPTGRQSYASIPGRPLGTPTPSPVALGGLSNPSAVPNEPTPLPQPVSPSSRPPPAAPRAAVVPTEPMTSTDDADSGGSHELPESPPPKGRGASSPEEANE
ncbi:MAG TPA: diadenylate cyclase CdaA [Polyangiaceae bacterium]|nr:diadenylate cyclase CdaA [Polyangiaceae bacterium]